MEHLCSFILHVEQFKSCLVSCFLYLLFLPFSVASLRPLEAKFLLYYETVFGNGQRFILQLSAIHRFVQLYRSFCMIVSASYIVTLPIFYVGLCTPGVLHFSLFTKVKIP